MKLWEQLHRPASESVDEATEKIRLTGEEYASQNPYYASIARGYHLAQMALFGLLAAFIILSMLIRSDDITYENFFYLFKDIHAAVDSDEVSFSTLVYDADETQDFATYRGGLAVAGESGLTVFTATGRQTLNQTLNMNSPILLSSSRGVLVYEQGGYHFALYNSFTRLHAGQTEGMLSCAAISDYGWFAVASHDGSSSNISLYDKHSKLKTEYFKNGFTTALALNTAGDLLAIVTTDAQDGAFLTRMELYRPGTDELLREWSFDHFFPITCRFADNKTLYLVGTDRMLILGQNGDTHVDITFDKTIERAFCSDHGYALRFSDGTLGIYDEAGTLIGQRGEAEDVRAVLVGEEKVYMMTEFTLMSYDIKTGEGSQTQYDFPLQELLWYAEDELLLCSRSTARFLRIPQ